MAKMAIMGTAMAMGSLPAPQLPLPITDAGWVAVIFSRCQGDREGRPSHMTKRLAKPVYGQGDREGRPDQRTLNAKT